MDNNNQAGWSSKIGFILAAAGSAVGLGNLWRFPYIAAYNGGGAFLLLYLITLFTIGFTLVVLETGIGYRFRKNPVDSMKQINKRFGFIGSVGIIAVTIILGFYSVVGGWIMHYLVFAASHPLSNATQEYFQSFVSRPVLPLLYTVLFLFATAFIVYRGVQEGIEKYSKIMMPLLFVLLFGLVVRSFFLPNAAEGLKYFFKPDFSKINSMTFFSTLGQAFFSLSVGMGIFITYGAYLPEDKKFPIGSSASVIALDTLVSVLAGMMIFPAIFSFNLSMNAGPTLIFITLPKIFASFPFGSIVGVVFFILLFLAALTSTISMIEVSVAYLHGKYGLPRSKAVIGYAIFCVVLAVPFSLAFGLWSDVKIFGYNFFDFGDTVASNILLPAGGFLMCVAVGWFYGAEKLRVFASDKANAVFALMVKYLAPAAVLLVFIDAMGWLK